MSSRLRIGCSSWTSAAWWGSLYPRRLAPRERLGAYARLFDTVEVDASYYRDPGPGVVGRWGRSTPDDFLFALKFPRELLDPTRPVDRDGVAAFETHAKELGPKLGALLLQFPPSATPARARGFLHELLLSLDPAIRYAVELRDAGWFRASAREALLAELARERRALAWSYLTYLEVPAEVTGEFVYLRFIGDHTSVPAAAHGELRVDRRDVTRQWADRVRRVPDRVSPVFAFFNNHFAGFAPASANLFRAELGLPPVAYAPEARAPGRQTALG